MSDLMHWWRGSSGSWFIHTVFPINSVPDFEGCNYIFAYPNPDGTRRPLYIGESGDGAVRFKQHEKLGRAIRLGGTEVHVHLLARTKQQRLSVETDLRNAFRTPLNEQPSMAPPFPSAGFGALSALLGIVAEPPASNTLSSLSAPRGVLTHCLGIAPAGDSYTPSGLGGIVAEHAPPASNPLVDLSSLGLFGIPSPFDISSPLGGGISLLGATLVADMLARTGKR